MENEYLKKLKELVLTALGEEKVKIVVFGSRARGDSNLYSDVDIGIIPYGKINKTKLVLLKEKVEDLNIPYKVEIVNFTEVSRVFKKEALKEAIVWKD
jgi:hypothetical protein